MVDSRIWIQKGPPRDGLWWRLRKEVVLQRCGMVRWWFLPPFTSMASHFPCIYPFEGLVLVRARATEPPLEQHSPHSALHHVVQGLPQHGPPLEALEAPLARAGEPRLGRPIVRQLLQRPSLWIMNGIVPAYSPPFVGAHLRERWFYVRNLGGVRPRFSR